MMDLVGTKIDVADQATSIIPFHLPNHYIVGKIFNEHWHTVIGRLEL